MGCCHGRDETMKIAMGSEDAEKQALNMIEPKMVTPDVTPDATPSESNYEFRLDTDAAIEEDSQYMQRS